MEHLIYNKYIISGLFSINAFYINGFCLYQASVRETNTSSVLYLQ